MKIQFCTILLTLVQGGLLAGEEPNFYPYADCLQLPIRIHIVLSQESAEANSRLESEEINRIIDKANRIWLQAGILLVPQKVSKEEAPPHEATPSISLKAGPKGLLQLRRIECIAPYALNIYYVHSFDVNGIYLPEAIFVQDSASLNAVPEGVNEALPRVTAHEIGHALGLEHRQNRTNLMASGTTGTWLNRQEIEKAREGIKLLHDRGFTNTLTSVSTHRFYSRSEPYKEHWDGNAN